MGGYDVIIYIAIIIGIFYLLIIRPQKKREQRRRMMLDNLKKGNRVVTIGGVHGVITSIKLNEVVLRVDEQKDIHLKLVRSAVNRLLDEEKHGEERESERE